MKTAVVWLAVLTAVLVTSASAQVAISSPFRLLQAVVFYGTPPTSGYDADVLREARQFAQRAANYRPRPRPTGLGSEMRMVYSAREGYEGKLVAAAGPGTERLAQQYVDDLRLCYEWESFADCPEREAVFAEKYLAANPNSPFRELLEMLTAHRWLCVAEAYEREGQADAAARARRAHQAQLASSLKAQSPMMRTAARELQTRGRCWPSGTVIGGVKEP
jgi:hypothetical protein